MNPRWMLTILVSLLLAALFFICTTPAQAQSSATGTITGQVTDQQNAAIAGAEVKLVDVSTNEAQTTVTNDVGRYSFISVPPGVYNLNVQHP
jgi:protocatechuate 3,4-dioxygenase beta subunit